MTQNEYSTEARLVAAASIIALCLSLGDILYSKAKHSELMADLLGAIIPHAEASTYDPCEASDPLGVGDPTPDDEEACTAWWDAQKSTGSEVTYYAPRGFPCNPEYGGECHDVYKYTTTPREAVGIWQQVLRYWFGQ